MTQIENRLNEDCNLIIRGTHKIVVIGSDVHIADKNTFKLRSLGAVKMADGKAKEAIAAEDGCKTCPIRKKCDPTKSVISDFLNRRLIPAIKTEFKNI